MRGDGGGRAHGIRRHGRRPAAGGSEAPARGGGRALPVLTHGRGMGPYQGARGRTGRSAGNTVMHAKAGIQVRRGPRFLRSDGFGGIGAIAGLRRRGGFSLRANIRQRIGKLSGLSIQPFEISKRAIICVLKNKHLIYHLSILVVEKPHKVEILIHPLGSKHNMKMAGCDQRTNN